MTMDYVRLGNTGLTVSRICLGCMSYGDPGATVAGSTMRWQWALKENEARPFFKRRRARHQLLRHGQRLLVRGQ